MSDGREKALFRRKEMKRNREEFVDRSGWWRNSIKDYPNPGSYHIRDFIEEMGRNPVPRTYGFKGSGRSSVLWCARRGDMLMPGAYNFTDSTSEALRHQATYSFKNSPRPFNDTLGVRDKDINISPAQYDLMKKPVTKSSCKHVMFRSEVQRISFLPKEGPAPGQYNPRPSSTMAVTSCFRSTVPRLSKVQSRTPGPGSYELRKYHDLKLCRDYQMDQNFDLLFRSTL